MKTRGFLIILFFALVLFVKVPATAQCAMCTLNAENSVKNGNTQGRGLNKGILFYWPLLMWLLPGSAFFGIKNTGGKTSTFIFATKRSA